MSGKRRGSNEKRDARIIALREAGDLTNKQIGEKVGLSHSRVTKVVLKARPDLERPPGVQLRTKPTALQKAIIKASRSGRTRQDVADEFGVSRLIVVRAILRFAPELRRQPGKRGSGRWV